MVLKNMNQVQINYHKLNFKVHIVSPSVEDLHGTVIAHRHVLAEVNLACSSSLQHIPKLGSLGGVVRVAPHAGGIHRHPLLLAEVDPLTCGGGHWTGWTGSCRNTSPLPFHCVSS